ncbi:MAG TPA: PEPxxWA-CTERM sorting domain-containing protein, partial [Phenylobacterium sp.]|nr:PEPxxWA-CTERM sorting domain-containing protein [Phenylobacterium sp.]
AGYSSFGDLFTEDLAGTTFATAGFTFDIFGDDYLTNLEAQALYTLSGDLTLSFDDLGNVIQGGNLLEAGLNLNGFTTAYDNPFALAYAWGETDVEVAVNRILGVGQSTKLYYRTTAYAATNTTCLDDAVTCLVAYSGFGDPIGRGGGVSSLRAFGPSALTTNTITGIVFDPQLIDPFRVDATDVKGAVPEPATWAMMLTGFGLLGAALRRRRAPSYS